MNFVAGLVGGGPLPDAGAIIFRAVGKTPHAGIVYRLGALKGDKVNLAPKRRLQPGFIEMRRPFFPGALNLLFGGAADQ